MQNKLIDENSTLVPGTSITIIRPAHSGATEDHNQQQLLTEDELDNPKSWHNTFQQKVQTRSPFFAMW